MNNRTNYTFGYLHCINFFPMAFHHHNHHHHLRLYTVPSFPLLGFSFGFLVGPKLRKIPWEQAWCNIERLGLGPKTRGITATSYPGSFSDKRTWVRNWNHEFLTGQVTCTSGIWQLRSIVNKRFYVFTLCAHYHM